MEKVVIIGASAAGISAAIYLARRNIKPLILGSDLGGEMALSGEVSNYPGFGMSDGWQLTEAFARHLKDYKLEPQLGIVVEGISKSPQGFIIKAKEGDRELSYEAQTVILASGAHPRELGIPGEDELRGKGLSYCTVCDGPLFKDQVTATIGGGDSANESGIMMNEIASQHYVLTKNPAMKGDPSLIAKLSSLPKVKIIPNALTTKILGTTRVEGIEYKDLASGELRKLGVQGAFIHVGMIPNSSFTPIELAKNERGEVVINKACQTNLPGFFAAGDVTDIQYKQIGIAVGQGICAALSCVDYLNKS